MKRILLSTVFLAAMAAPVAAANLEIEVWDNGSLIATTTSISGVASLTVASDPAFSTINVLATGNPVEPLGDLTSVTLNATSASITSTHTLEIEVFQTGIAFSGPVVTNSTFTANDLVGDASIGPTQEATYIDGTINTLGTLLESASFPLGTADGKAGPFGAVVPPISADAEFYEINFNGSFATAQDTIALTAVPEPGTWAMFTLGFLFLIWGRATKRRYDTI